MAYPKRIDANQREIVKVLKQCGASVTSLAAVGKGVPDLLVGYRGHTLLMEIKDGKKPPAHRKLTSCQVSFHSTWRGGALATICDVEGALTMIKMLGVSSS